MSWSERRVNSLEVWPQLIYSKETQELPKELILEVYYLKVLINKSIFLYPKNVECR